VPSPQYALAHEIWITRGSLLWDLMQEKLAEGDACQVNSRHHQAVKKPACSFEVTATAPDGVIEAIECGSGGFCLGVQWHPENFVESGTFLPLFAGLLAAAR
jgi:putative glutamine amidotransferase